MAGLICTCCPFTIPLCALASGTSATTVWPRDLRNSSSLTKKKSLSFLIAPPRLPPNWFCRNGGLTPSKKVARVESAVAQKLICRSMEFVGAGFGDGIHHGSIAAELSAVGIGENRELRDSLNTQRGAH